MTRTLYDASASAKYSFGMGKSISLSYSYRTSLPSEYAVLNVTDYSNPLFITSGNEDLKDMLTHKVTLNAYLGRLLNASVEYTTTRNDIGQRTFYDAKTGVRRTGAVNVNGNYGINTRLGVYFMLGNVSVSSNSMYSFGRQKNYYDTGDGEILASSNNNTVSNFTTLSYGNKFFNMMLDFNYMFNNIKSVIFSSNSIDYNTTGSFTFNLPMDINIDTDISWQSRHGTAVIGSNRDCVVWNAGIEKKFLASRRATIGFKAYDILHKRNQRDVTVVGDTWTSEVKTGKTAFFLVTFAYRMSMM